VREEMYLTLHVLKMVKYLIDAQIRGVAGEALRNELGVVVCIDIPIDKLVVYYCVFCVV
jgi:hypothetical protein